MAFPFNKSEFCHGNRNRGRVGKIGCPPQASIDTMARNVLYTSFQNLITYLNLDGNKIFKGVCIFYPCDDVQTVVNQFLSNVYLERGKLSLSDSPTLMLFNAIESAYLTCLILES